MIENRNATKIGLGVELESFALACPRWIQVPVSSQLPYTYMVNSFAFLKSLLPHTQRLAGSLEYVPPANMWRQSGRSRPEVNRAGNKDWKPQRSDLLLGLSYGTDLSTDTTDG